MRSRNPVIPIAIAAALVSIGVVTAALSRTQLTPLRYFPETGHMITDPFLSYFDDHGGAGVFGYPLTDPYTLPDGTLAQTFQRAQLTMTVHGVELAPINRQLGIGQDVQDATIAGEFAAYHKALGGEGFFGKPMAGAHTENGVLVQDFERARLTRGTDGEVRLADLGVMVLSVYPAPPQGQASIGLRGTPMPPPAIRASVSVEHPAVGQRGQQTIYLLVEDDQDRPVAGAHSLAVLRYGSATAEVDLPPTDASGVASAQFLAPPAPSGSRVTVQMNVLIGEVFITVETTYFQWW